MNKSLMMGPHSLVSLAFIFFCIVYLTNHERMYKDPDTGWHLMAGEIILETGEIPLKDPISYTSGDYPWYNMAWAFDVVIHLIDRAAGLPFLAVVMMVLLAGVMAATMALCLRGGGGFIASVIVVTLAGIMMTVGLLVRPHILTYILVLVYFFICRYRPREWPIHWILPALMVLWVNGHGGYLAGFSVIGAFGLEALLKKDWFMFRRLFLAGVLCIFATLLNPLGPEIYTAAWRSLGGILKHELTEWRPINVLQLSPITAFLLIFMLVHNMRETRIGIAERVLAFVWFFCAVNSIRHLPIFALLSAPYMAMMLTRFLHEEPHTGAFWVRKDHSFMQDMEKPGFRRCVWGLALLMPVFMATPPLRQAVIGGEIGFPVEKYPEEEVAYILEHHPEKRFLNHYNVGGGITYLSNNKIQTFIDSRAETAHPPEVVSDYLDYHYKKPGWEKILGKYEIDGIMMPKNGESIPYLDRLDGWELVFEGRSQRIYMPEELP